MKSWTHPADYFSTQAADYARFRPHYPARLFDYFASLSPSRQVAWDCATGSGQAAVPLAEHFAQVVATDASEAQVRRAVRHERVHYAVSAAAVSGIASCSVGLVTVAQALHWLDLEAFYAEVKRVLRPDGILAVSSYGSASLDDPVLSAVLAQHEHGTMGRFWPSRRQFVGEATRTLAFPFRELTPPEIPLEVNWTLAELVGYARSWSATARYVKAIGEDPTPQLEAALRPHWGPPERRHVVRWPFVVRVGRMER
jgi:SAM-dependent methyltransferase